MKLIKRKNGYYYIYYNRQLLKSLKTKDKTLATKLFEYEKTAQRDKKIIQLEKYQRIKLSEFKQEYLSYRELQDIKSETWDNDDLAFRRFIEVVGDLPLRSVDRKIIDEFKGMFLRLGKSKTYINILLRSLRTAFNYALGDDEQKGYIDKNPFLKIRGKPPVLFKIDEPLPRFLAIEEIEALFKAIDDDAFLLAVNIYLYAGLRRAELMRLNVQDIDLQNRFIYVRGAKGKKDEAVPINDKLEDILIKNIKSDIGHLFPRWRSPDTYSRLFKKYATKAGIDAKLHDLRHTFGTYLAIQGEDIKKIKELMRHRDIKTTEIYVKLRKEHLRTAVNKLNFKIKECQQNASNAL